jgi:adenylosuccinate lyase
MERTTTASWSRTAKEVGWPKQLLAWASWPSSANRRSLVPEAFLITDELLITSLRILRGLRINQTAVERNLRAYAPFACTERILMALVRAGADRQEMHERLRILSQEAWQFVQNGQENPLIAMLIADEVINQRLSLDEIDRLSDVGSYLGFAESRAREMAGSIRAELELESR